MPLEHRTGHFRRDLIDVADQAAEDSLVGLRKVGEFKAVSVIPFLGRRNSAADGGWWYEVARKGSHVQFRHATKPGRVTVPHPKRDIPIGTLRSIEKQAGIKLR